MIFTVDPTKTIKIEDGTYLLDFVKIKSALQRDTFLVRVDPLDDFNLPDHCFEFEGSSKSYFFVPFLGFDLETTSCQNWLSWTSVQTKDSTIVELLRIREGTDLSNLYLTTSFQCKFLLRHNFVLNCNHKPSNVKKKLRKRKRKRKTCEAE